MLFSWPDTPKVSLPMGASTPHLIHVPWTHPSQYPKLHLDRSAIFAQFMAASPYTLQCALKHY